MPGVKDRPTEFVVQVIPETPQTDDFSVTQTQNEPASRKSNLSERKSIRSHDYANEARRSITSPPAISLHRAITPVPPDTYGSPVNSGTQEKALAALAIGAPLIASVVVGAQSVIVSEIQAAADLSPKERSAALQATIALLWVAVIMSLGSTMVAVAGIAMAAGYHDSHVGITKTIVRKLRELRHRTEDPIPYNGGHPLEILDSHDAPSNITVRTVERYNQRAEASMRAAEVSARLLGLSIIVFTAALGVHMISVYPLGVIVTVFSAAGVTALAAIIPLLPVFFPKLRHS